MTKAKHSFKENLWAVQNQALRDPVEIFAGSFDQTGIHPNCLKYKTTGNFVDLLEEKKITLLISREYENLLIALSTAKNQLSQSFFHLPHPSGIVVEREKNSVFVASTRNPNQIIELKPIKDVTERLEDKTEINPEEGYLLPSRAKYFSGSHYFHELAIINNGLYGLAVGMNGIVKIDLNSAETDEICWWPRCIEEDGKPNFKSNFLQFNSIAAGSSLEQSFYTASGDRISSRRPGHRNYPTDKKGIVISGWTRDVIARGLTRPHSAKLIDNKIWLDNSGYGEVGYIDEDKFVPTIKLPGWTRGLCHIDGLLFVGVSRILPRFKSYAPGLKGNNYLCSVFAIDMKSGKIIGSISWPNGNQIFAIDWIKSSISRGFLFKSVKNSSAREVSFFYRFKI